MPVRYETRAPGTIYERRVPIFLEPMTDAEREERDRMMASGFAALYGSPIYEFAQEELSRSGIEIADIEIKPTMDGRPAVRGQDFEVDSLPDFALRMLRYLREVIAATEIGDADAAARWAYELGITAEMARTKFGLEAHALRGKKNADRLNESAERRNRAASMKADRQYARWHAKATEIWSRRPELSANAVAQQIAASEPDGPNPNTIRRKIKRQ